MREMTEHISHNFVKPHIQNSSCGCEYSSHSFIARVFGVRLQLCNIAILFVSFRARNTRVYCCAVLYPLQYDAMIYIADILAHKSPV